MGIHFATDGRDLGDSIQARFPAFAGIGGTTEGGIVERMAKRKQKSQPGGQMSKQNPQILIGEHCWI
ncbi:MAG TPA: hypothetical protein VN901_05375 [Candidatus Acidoferrales bacterium]|nr:hypothetical protein [Candidatus Acidoferrales bacterium]